MKKEAKDDIKKFQKIKEWRRSAKEQTKSLYI
jgi:hypothetical protein